MSGFNFQFQVGDIIFHNSGVKYTIIKKVPFDSPPDPDGDVTPGYEYTLNDGSIIRLIVGRNRDESGNFWDKYSVAQGIKRRKSNKKRRSNKKRTKKNKKRKSNKK
jgi:hypothetical protein